MRQEKVYNLNVFFKNNNKYYKREVKIMEG